MRSASRKRRAPTWLPQTTSKADKFVQRVNGRFQEGVALQEAGKFEEALGIFKWVAQTLERAGVKDASIYAALGYVSLMLGQGKDTLEYSRKALEIDPDFVKALINASAACRVLDLPGEAYKYAQRAHELEPTNPQPLGALATILVTKGLVSQGLARAAYAVHIDPESQDGIGALAGAYSRIGDMDMALPYYEKFIKKMPFDSGVSSGYLFTLHYKADITRDELKTAHKQWGDRFGSKFKKDWPIHKNDRNSNRRLRIGYVSGDFRHHVVGYWTKHIVEAHDRNRFEVFCFANNREDEFSQKFKAAADHWVPIIDLNDDEAARTIQDAKIDILVDLSGHTGGHRLLMMARKPAPVQASWCGYIDSTGLEAIDYVITDKITSPESEPSPFVEEPLRLRNGSVCFEQIQDVPEVGPLPCLTNGFFTFGCFNNPAKISPEVVKLWTTILKAVPDSQLMLAYGNLGDVATRERIVRLFHEQGIESDRLKLRKGERKAALAAYAREIDLALDTFPYTGGTTTCEALWMGVPVVALYGTFPVSRFSCSLLAYAGLPGLTTNTHEEYIERATHLAHNVDTLAYIRSNLRSHLAQTPLFNTKLFLEGLEEAYVEIFDRWCRSGSGVGITAGCPAKLLRA